MKHCFNKKFHLIKSQIELIKALAKGETLKQTAKNMGLKYFNLQKRPQLLYKKFNVTNRNALITLALDKKIITTKELTNKYRKRFTFFLTGENKINCSLIKLTNEEKIFLKLYFEGNTINKIILKQPLHGKYHARCIKESICRKFELRRLNQIIKYYYMLHKIYDM